MSSSSQKMITLRSSNGETFELEESAAVQSRLIESRIEGGYADDVIPLLNTSSEILSRVIQYCKKHAEYAASAAAAAPDADRSGEEALKAWDAEFVQVDTSTLFHLTLVRAE